MRTQCIFTDKLHLQRYNQQGKTQYDTKLKISKLLTAEVELLPHEFKLPRCYM